MGLLSNFLGVQNFSGKVDKLFKFYKTNTRIVSIGSLESSRQLENAISAIANVLGEEVDQLSYEEVKQYGEIFVTVLARTSMAGFLGSSGLIERTSSIILKKYSIIRTKTNADEIVKMLFDMM